MKKTLTLFLALFIGMMTFATDWSSIAYLADGAGDGAYANKYKVAAAFGQNVINIQKPDFAAAPGIYTNFPAGISSCSLNEGDYVIAGSGMILYLSAFTAKCQSPACEALRLALRTHHSSPTSTMASKRFKCTKSWSFPLRLIMGLMPASK